MVAFWAPDIFPLCFNSYLLKRPMLFADKLINRHSLLLGKNTLFETHPFIYIFGQKTEILEILGGMILQSSK